MQNISVRIVLAIMVLLVVSCSEPRGTYLGYSRPVNVRGSMSLSRTNLKDDLYESLGAKGSGLTLRELYPAEYEAMRYYPKFPPANSAKMMAHGHSRVEYYENAVFCQEGYVSECDIARLQTVLEKVASNKLGSMLALMNRSCFEYHRFSHVFMPLLSKAIIDKINSVERTDPYTDLGGWQMFKPTKGLDEEATKYAVMASDDGWFDIVSADNTNVVSVKVMYGGKYLNPIIVGVKNKTLGVDICDTNYDHRADKKMLACTPYDDEYMFLKFLGAL